MDRRKTKDFWARLLVKLNLISWGILILILFVFHRAQPEFESFFDRFYQLSLRTSWDVEYLYYLMIIVIAGVLVSIFGLVLGVFRGRRSKDHKNALIFTGILSSVLLAVCLSLI